MKLLQMIIFAGISFLMVTSCKKETSDNANTKIVAPHYPTIEFNGSQFLSFPVGSPAYTDAGANGVDDISGAKTPIQPEPGVPVDMSTPGLYTVAFVTRNDDGYISKATRYIAVTDIPEAADLSGVYKRGSAVVNITEVANGLYNVDNVGGNAPAIASGYFVQTGENTIDFPAQPSEVGTLDVLDEGFTVDGGKRTFTWALDNPAFGTQTRFFVQE